MVLAIGILVDDAIVVVENVERIMSEEGLSPKEATRKAMGQITGAIIGITLVLMSVFVPMAFFPGSVGIIYRQFSVSMVAAIGFSALLALSLTPALCATILKPVAAGHHHAARGLFGWFNRRMEQAKDGYARWVRWSILRAGRFMLIYAAMLVAVGLAFFALPGGFLPVDDQGFITTDVQTPPEASFPRTLEAIKRVEDYLTKRAGVDTRDIPDRLQLPRPGAEHRAGLHHAEGLVGARRGRLGRTRSSPTSTASFAPLRDGKISALQPPPIDNLGNSQRLQLPPAGSRPARLCRADAREGPVAGRCRAEPDAAGRLCRRPVARAAGRAGHRPREGGRARRHLRGDQQHHLDQSRLGLHQRLSQSRTHAAGHRAGRPQCPHAGRSNPDLQCPQHARPARADVVVRDGALVGRPVADRRLQLLSLGADLRLGQARLYQRRRDPRDGTARGASAARLRLRMDRAVAAGEAVRLAGAASC